MRPFTNAPAHLALAGLLGTLAGCSEYLDRRDTVALSAGDAVATNKVTQMVDPWPRAPPTATSPSTASGWRRAVEALPHQPGGTARGTSTSGITRASRGGKERHGADRHTVTPPAAAVK